MATITRPTITRPTLTKTGSPGQFLYAEYLRARDHHALVRRDRLARNLPRTLAKAVPVALLISLVMAFGAGLPGGFAFLVFVLVIAGWTGVAVASAFGDDGEIEHLRTCAEAERRTARTISRLGRQGYAVLHDRIVPTTDATVGHVLIGPGGVIVLNSEPAEGVVRYTKKVASVDGEPLTTPIERTAFLGSEIRTQLRAAVPMVKITVSPVLVMTEADVLWKDGAVDGVTVISIKDVIGYVRSRPSRLNPAEVKQVVTAVQRLFPPFTGDRLTDQVTMHRDQWVLLMDALRTIRERDGDATDLLDRLAQIESDLGRQADGFARRGIPGEDADSAELRSDLETIVDFAGGPDSTGAVTPLRPAGRSRGARRSLSSVRPERDDSRDGGQSGSAT
jgi:hypothetical protein